MSIFCFKLNSINIDGCLLILRLLLDHIIKLNTTLLSICLGSLNQQRRGDALFLY